MDGYTPPSASLRSLPIACESYTFVTLYPTLTRREEKIAALNLKLSPRPNPFADQFETPPSPAGFFIAR